MKCEAPKRKRKVEEIQRLKKELIVQKKKVAVLEQQKTVRIDDEQMQSFLDELTGRIEWSTNRIVDETPKTTVLPTQQNYSNNGFSWFIKCIIAVPFFLVTIAVIYVLVNSIGDLWRAGWATRIAIFIFALAGFDSFFLGVEIIKEKDRNYILSLFSALVALVALIVAVVK